MQSGSVASPRASKSCVEENIRTTVGSGVRSFLPPQLLAAGRHRLRLRQRSVFSCLQAPAGHRPCPRAADKEKCPTTDLQIGAAVKNP